MKKIIAVGAAGLLAISLLGGSASAGKKKSYKQTQEGTIMLPAPFAQDMSKCYAGLHRRSDTLSQGNENGITGYHFDVDKKTWNKPFNLAVTAAEGDADLDIYFYSHYPTVDEWQNDPQNAGAPVSVDFINRKVGGEKGKVPAGTTKAIVCLYGGDPGTGAYYATNAAFKYVAGK